MDVREESLSSTLAAIRSGWFKALGSVGLKGKKRHLVTQSTAFKSNDAVSVASHFSNGNSRETSGGLAIVNGKRTIHQHIADSC